MVKLTLIYEAPVYYRQKVIAKKAIAFERMAPKLGRNEICPCGSGVKFKKCHKTEESLLTEAYDQLKVVNSEIEKHKNEQEI